METLTAILLSHHSVFGRSSASQMGVCLCSEHFDCFACWSLSASCQLWGASWWSWWRPWTMWPPSACFSCSSSLSSGTWSYLLWHYCHLSFHTRTCFECSPLYSEIVLNVSVKELFHVGWSRIGASQSFLPSGALLVVGSYQCVIFFHFVFSILGMHLFGCKFTLRTDSGDTITDRKNFDSLLWAIVTVFQVMIVSKTRTSLTST